jgi:hypothetical protein
LLCLTWVASFFEKGEEYVILRWNGFHVAGAALVLAATNVAGVAALPSHAQANRPPHANSASHISAEVVRGRFNPAESKPGDTVAIKLKDDVRSNGEVVLKKGAVVTGVIRNVNRGHSMIEVEWLAPALQGRTERTLSLALQSVMQVNPVRADEVRQESSALNSSSTAYAARSGNGLLASVDAPVPVGAISRIASGRSNMALLSMPSVVAVDQETASAIETTLGTSSSGQLFRVGHGELVSALGSKQSVELYSHLSNDTIIASGRNFEISSGAQIQMLVGVNRN